MRAITFDFHNTLVECDPWFDLEVKHLPGAVLIRMAAEGTITYPDGAVEAANEAYATLRKAVMASGDEMDASACVAAVFAELGFAVDQDAIDATIAALMRETLDHARLVAGARETAAELHSRGIPLAIISSAVYHPFLEWALNRFGLAAAFPVVITSASCGYYKSRHEIFDLTLAALGASAGESVHIGDSLRFDVGGAQRAGMRTVWLRRAERHPHATEEPTATPDLTVTSLQGAAPAILDLLDGAATVGALA